MFILFQRAFMAYVGARFRPGSARFRAHVLSIQPHLAAFWSTIGHVDDALRLSCALSVAIQFRRTLCCTNVGKPNMFFGV